VPSQSNCGRLGTFVAKSFDLFGVDFDVMNISCGNDGNDIAVPSNLWSTFSEARRLESVALLGDDTATCAKWSKPIEVTVVDGVPPRPASHTAGNPY
jgi:hypothetical protein